MKVHPAFETKVLAAFAAAAVAVAALAATSWKISQDAVEAALREAVDARLAMSGRAVMLRETEGLEASRAYTTSALVRDTGIGIKPEDFGKLFIEFHQLDSSLGRQHQAARRGARFASVT